jgi:hypothetical protein
MSFALDDACTTQDLQVLGNVVLSDIQPLD